MYFFLFYYVFLINPTVTYFSQISCHGYILKQTIYNIH